MDKEKLKNILIIVLFVLLYLVVLFTIVDDLKKIKCEVLDPTTHTCFCGKQIDENNFKTMEIGVIKFYDEGTYCQLKEMEIKLGG